MRSCTYPHEVVADLRAEPSANRERKARAVDLTTKQFWQYQTSLRSNKLKVIARTLTAWIFPCGRSTRSQVHAASARVVRHLLPRRFPDATRVEPEVFMGARIQAERIVFLVIAHGVVTLLPEQPKRSPALYLPPVQLCCPTISSTARPLEDPPPARG